MPDREGSPAATPSGEIIAEAARAAEQQAEGTSEGQPSSNSSEIKDHVAPHSGDARGGGSSGADRSDSPTGSTPDSGDQKEDEEEEETCGFCIFMKAGGCKTSFDDWSKCIDTEREKGGDYPSDCREQTFALRECMLEHKEYYAPLLQDEVDFVADKEEEDRAEAAAAVSGR